MKAQSHDPKVVRSFKPTTYTRLEIDREALHAAQRSPGDGAITPSYGPWREDIVRLLNDALATELVCVLRYKRHHFTAHGLSAPSIAAEFMEHARAEAEHADRLARRIVELGGEPDFAPTHLMERSHAAYDDSLDLRSMLLADLVAERVAVESYRQMIVLVGDKDPTTRRLLEEVLQEEEGHANELADLLYE